MEELYSVKCLVLARYLNLEENEIEDISQFEEDGIELSYAGDDYEIYSERELEDYISSLIEDKIGETQYEINNTVELSDHYENGYYMKVIVDEDAIEYELNENFGYHMGNYDNDYDEFEGYYIFKK